MVANHNKGYFALDITSVSSYSEFIDYICWGYNRDGGELPQINLLMLTSEETRLPVYYKILSGSIKDVFTINKSLASLKLLGSHSVHLVMDKGFFSGANIKELYNSHYRFSVGVPFTSSIATAAVEEKRMGMDSHEHFISVGSDDLYAAGALNAYRQKDAVEKGFDDFKNDLDMKRRRIHSNAAMEGRIFIQFIALILTTYLKRIMKRTDGCVAITFKKFSAK